MNLEGFSKKGAELGNDPEGIKDSYNLNGLQQEYKNAVKRLALDKMRNSALYEGQLGAAMRRLTSLGMEISKEQIIKDVQKEIDAQSNNLDLESDFFGPQSHMSAFDTKIETPLNFDRPVISSTPPALEPQTNEEPIVAEKSSEDIQKEQVRKEFMEQVERTKKLLEETKDAEPTSPEILDTRDSSLGTNQEVSDNEVRRKIIIGILKLENPYIDFNYVPLPDVMKRFQDMSMQELSDYRDNLISQSTGKAM